jgi:hypothetical protein
VTLPFEIVESIKISCHLIAPFRKLIYEIIISFMEYVCMNDCTYVCMFVRMYVFMYVHVCMYVCMHVCMYVCMYVCIE